MLVDFALGLLHTGLKKGNLGGQSTAALALLDPMLPLLVRALGSRHANSVSLALKCLAFLIRLPLPSMPFLCSLALWESHTARVPVCTALLFCLSQALSNVPVI